MGKYGEFSSEDDVLDYIVDFSEIYEGEGMEEVFAMYMKLPMERKTKAELETICRDFDFIEIDVNDPQEWMVKI